nr:VCBS repeat-containing protein [Robertkochia sp. 3YJGBD-33]
MILLACKKEDTLFVYLEPEKSGIEFANILDTDDTVNILDYLYYYNGGGVSIGDVNNDGLPDIYLSGNRVPNKLYLNKGGLRFEDITETAGVSGTGNWNTGTVMADVNGDGYLDIFVSAVSGIHDFQGHHELFINQGDLTFKEMSEAYNLNLESYGTHAAFFDYDLDGDLDLYLLNHAVHTQESYGDVSLRDQRNPKTGDRLMRNDGDHFTDVSEAAGIYGGINGFGLGIAVSDFDKNGYPDLYIGNDFHEDDYFYLNQGDGTFKESVKAHFKHISRFSMGNDVADINHDGWPDLLSLDMLPEKEIPLKASEGDDNVQMMKLRTQKLGYHYQFTRNMLQLNRGGEFFTEAALHSGIAATDWSWSALFSDFNQDGNQDLFIANGIPKRPNDLDYIRFISSGEIKASLNPAKGIDKEALDRMPSGTVPNYIFEGSDSLFFSDRSNTWLPKETTNATAAAYGDLDLDGDLDLVINNVNAPATVLINQTDQKATRFLKLKLKANGKNSFGTGTKVTAYSNGKIYFRELYPVRGFQSSSEPFVHIGFPGNVAEIDSVLITWPDRSETLLRDVPTNTTLKTVQQDTYERGVETPLRNSLLFEKSKNNLGIDYVHTEDNYVDFNNHKLIPYQVSDRGPAFASGDLNGDGKTDLFFGSSRYFPSKIYLQNEDGFTEQNFDAVAGDSISEDTGALILDFDNNGLNDLITTTGGAHFFGKAAPLLDHYYAGEAGMLVKKQLPESYQNNNVIAAADYDGDGDLDLFLGSHTNSDDFGVLPESVFLLNEKGVFREDGKQQPGSVGMVTDAVWQDINEDGWPDLLVVGEWMSPVLFMNEKGSLKRASSVIPDKLNGLWQAVQPFDIDDDGDLDFILGNWGSNTKFRATEQAPLRMYHHDFDKNGKRETIVTQEHNGEYYTFDGLDHLASQMPTLMRKKFTRYRDFAGKPIHEVIDQSLLDQAQKLEVHELRSGILLNEEGIFKFIPFGEDLQLAPITAFTLQDFNKDGQPEVLAGGNYFGVRPYHGRFDGFPGALITDIDNVHLTHEYGLNLSGKAIRALDVIEFAGDSYLVVTINNSEAEIYRINNPKINE